VKLTGKAKRGGKEGDENEAGKRVEGRRGKREAW
jgi:hypothetical protein